MYTSFFYNFHFHYKKKKKKQYLSPPFLNLYSTNIELWLRGSHEDEERREEGALRGGNRWGFEDTGRIILNLCSPKTRRPYPSPRHVTVHKHGCNICTRTTFRNIGQLENTNSQTIRQRQFIPPCICRRWGGEWGKVCTFTGEGNSRWRVERWPTGARICSADVATVCRKIRPNPQSASPATRKKHC